jgi:hypothetical protein
MLTVGAPGQLVYWYLRQHSGSGAGLADCLNVSVKVHIMFSLDRKLFFVED